MRDVKQGLDQAPSGAGGGAADGWESAVQTTERWLARSDRVDTLLEGLPAALAGQERARCQHLFYGVVRWFSLIESGLAGLMAHAPRTRVRAILMVAGFEVLEGKTDASAKIVHHAVERAKTLASQKEAGLINAVARKLAARLVAGPVKTGVVSADLAVEFAHPEWLVQRWLKLFGPDATRQLLEWNQQPARVYARARTDAALPDFLAPTPWPAFFEVKAGHWDAVRQLVHDGVLYLQDPSTRLSVDLLAPKPGESVLDCCAAPGGKSLLIADRMQTGRVVALDLPAKLPEAGAPPKPDLRLVRLKENLSRAPAAVQVSLAEVDLTKVGTDFYRNLNLPADYDAVLLDAPCSNTGVMRHRIDVKWRLEEGDFGKHAKQQLALLHAAARLVRNGGRLVYSTCSLDAEENDRVLKAFFDTRAGGPFKVEQKILSLPWIDGHDGAGAFLLRKA
ncbi:MAG: RNA methyltransferase [Opitutae bacterium]|nr:RNA methyltransferase [Opitutae bacterium]